jgi:hypothetical protein
LSQLAQQRAGALLLLLEEHLELLIGDEAHIDEDLTDATDSHGGLSSKFDVPGSKLRSGVRDQGCNPKSEI